MRVKEEREGAEREAGAGRYAHSQHNTATGRRKVRANGRKEHKDQSGKGSRVEV